MRAVAHDQVVVWPNLHGTKAWPDLSTGVGEEGIKMGDG
jgi:hypothetical protein